MNVENLKSNVVEAPTMFIGVGGTGCKIVKKVFNHCSKQERENISFVCLDTNVNDLLDIIGDNKEIKYVQTSNTQTVGSYLDIDKDAAKNWFPKNAVIYDKTVSEGAGQLRAISRLAFNSTIKTGKISPLYDAIDNLFKKNGQAMKQALRVCVVSTASGGTGSGMILPFCMFVRDYVNNKYPNASVILRTLILLPETLDKVIKSNIEKDSQRRNAYATIKELNAFMMKGSGFCDIEEELKRYKDLRVDITDPGRKELKTLSLLPCDFCFLIDGQDAEDATSNNFEQYQDQAALALYEQNVGPMQKKAFSVEDNIIKELSNPGNFGRNRFGGIGAGRIIYPYRDIVKYISYDWAKDSIGGSGEAAKWIKYDREVANKAKKEKDEGKSSKERTDLEQLYIDELINDTTSNFSKDLVNQYMLLEADTRIEAFTDAFERTVIDAVNNNAAIKSSRNTTAKLKGENTYDDPDQWTTAQADYQGLVSYLGAVRDNAVRVAQSVSQGILYTEKNTYMLAKDGEQFLESILRTPDGHYCHPNAARYMLYLLTETIKEYPKTFYDDAASASKKVDGFTMDRADRPYPLKSKKEITSLKGLCDALAQLDAKKGKDKKGGMEIAAQLNTEMKGFCQSIEKYQTALIKNKIYEVLLDYVQSLNKEYEKFFNGFEKKVEHIELLKKDLVEALRYNKGDSVLNVCAKKEMLEELSKSTFTQMRNGQMLSDELNASIFDKIRANAKFERDRQINNDIIGAGRRVDIFDEVLLGYFEEAVARDCDKQLNLDIIHAIAQERTLQEVIVLREKAQNGEDVALDVSASEYKAYIKALMARGEKISAPGVQRIVGEEAREINVSAYNKVLKDIRDYDMGDILPNGTAVDTVSKYEIHFFNALYNLTPDKLKKFAAPKLTDTGNRAAGLYHNAYTVYTRDIGPDCLKSSKMTTHIDRRWDSIAAMPELDLEYQAEQFLRTHKAMIYGLVFQRIKKMPYLDDNSKVENPAMAYRYLNTHNHIEDMIVSNGTLCDEFYEILDSLYIDRALVENVYEYERKETARDIMQRSDYLDTKFNKYVEDFVLDDAGDRRASLFEIPLAFYNSLPSYKHDESEINSIVDAVIDVFRKQIQKYESEKNAKFVLCSELKKQYDLLLKNYEENESVNNAVSKRENKILEIIARKVQDIFESSPQPENYELTIEEMKMRLLSE